MRAVVVAWLVELSLPKPEVRGLNPISHINDQYLKKNLIQALARGETLVIRNAENNFEHLYLPFVRKFFKKEKETIYITFAGSLCHYNANFKLRIILPSFKNILLTSKVLVMNFKYEFSDLETFFFNIISLKKLSPIFQQRREMFYITSEANAASEKSHLEIVNCLSLSLEILLIEEQPLQTVNTIRENIHASAEKKTVHEQYLKTAENNLEINFPLAHFCALIFTELAKFKKICSVYSVSLARFVEILNLKEEDSDDVEESEVPKNFGDLLLNGDEHKLLSNLFSKLELTMKMCHFTMISFTLCLAICKAKRYIDESSIQRFVTQINQIDHNQKKDILQLLMPSLTESEAKVIYTVIETSENEDIFKTTEEIPELTFLQRLSVVSVFSIETLINSVKMTLSNLLEIELPGM